jgi:hypothetical protein
MALLYLQQDEDMQEKLKLFAAHAYREDKMCPKRLLSAKVW